MPSHSGSKAQSAFQFKDNRPEAATQRKVQDMANGRSSAKAIAQRHALEDEGTNETESEMMEEQKQAEMAPSETAGHEEAPVQMVPFNKKQRDRILAKNYARNGNFYTCQNPLCGFQHGLLNYATYKGRRQGDGGFHVDHIHAAANGGRALIRNAQVLCGTCNTSKGRRAPPGDTALINTGPCIRNV